MRYIFRDVRRPLGRLFLCLISLLICVRVHASGPTLTTISDIVYRVTVRRQLEPLLSHGQTSALPTTKPWLPESCI